MNYQNLYETDLKMKQVIYSGINDWIDKWLNKLTWYIVDNEKEYKQYVNLVNKIIESWRLTDELTWNS